MDELVLKGTKTTPSIHFNMNEGELLLEGRSLPENTDDYFKPIIKWVDKYISTKHIKTNIHLKLEYFNTSSSKFIIHLLQKIKPLNNLNIYWYSHIDDEDMLETGKEFSDIIETPFLFKPLS